TESTKQHKLLKSPWQAYTKEHSSQAPAAHNLTRYNSGLSPFTMNNETTQANSSSLEWAHPLVRDWFVSRFGTPTEPQLHGWPRILGGKTTLISAPTGSGKTLAAFLICIDRLVRKAISGELTHCTEVLYVSPLKALSND